MEIIRYNSAINPLKILVISKFKWYFENKNGIILIRIR
jgi:hypothetical protein